MSQPEATTNTMHFRQLLKVATLIQDHVSNVEVLSIRILHIKVHVPSSKAFVPGWPFWISDPHTQ